MKIFFLFIISFFGVGNSFGQEMPSEFVHINEKIPDIIYEIRYAGTHNFIGRPIEGYEAKTAILARPAAEALAKVQQELIRQDLMLKIFDAYRPQRAVNDFVQWARKPGDTLTKQQFYPEVPKSRLFELGYIASKSGHSRGGTVDLTLVKVSDCTEVDMGSPYDFFGEISHHDTAKISEEQKKNRQFLKDIMRKYGFRSYSEEWWHYTFNAEPFPYQYFDFPVM
ncbi:M15 family metallopeptidase [Gramella sp. AN32]|uniref:D-alanyl-D-alanine dipeptidase n=1 Tax=Christiangramia antarctica TaxID=2058158 RepID=A0ABW5X5F0_9FLAO|nr:M15 family metallopeptidase [Gramella sp. AN32]MCM4157893.1 peptidase M15 [Gramella sp. AN32]